MTIFRQGDKRRKHHGERVTSESAGYFDLESEVLQDDEYAWSWGMAHAFKEAFEVKFGKSITLSAKYVKGLLGRCSNQFEGFFIVELRPTLRGSEAWRTFFHELAHVIDPDDESEGHGKTWEESLVTVHNFWKEFLKGLEGDLKTRLIEMVTNYGYWRGRPIGMDEKTDPWNRPWARQV